MHARLRSENMALHSSTRKQGLAFVESLFKRGGKWWHENQAISGVHSRPSIVHCSLFRYSFKLPYVQATSHPHAYTQQSLAISRRISWGSVDNALLSAAARTSHPCCLPGCLPGCLVTCRPQPPTPALIVAGVALGNCKVPSATTRPIDILKLDPGQS